MLKKDLHVRHNLYWKLSYFLNTLLFSRWRGMLLQLSGEHCRSNLLLRGCVAFGQVDVVMR